MNQKVNVNYGIFHADNGSEIYIRFNNRDNNNLVQAQALATVESLFMNVIRDNLEVKWSEQKGNYDLQYFFLNTNQKVSVTYGIFYTYNGSETHIKFNNLGNNNLAQEKAKKVFATIETFFMDILRDNLEAEWSKQKDNYEWSKQKDNYDIDFIEYLSRQCSQKMTDLHPELSSETID